MGRRRSALTRDLPPNLYVRRGYYAWTDPRDGKVYSLGKDKRQAINEAVEANLSLTESLNRARLVNRLDGNQGNTLEAWCDKYETILEERKLSKGTLDSYRQRLKALRENHGSELIARITTRHIAEFLAQWKTHARMGQAVRSLLLDLFREAMAAGWTDSNPVEPTRAPRHEITRARLTIADYQAIHKAAAGMPPWVQHSMELAIVTGQRRADLAKLGPRDVKEGKLWITQQKTGAKVCIPLELKLEAIGLSVGQVIERCRDSVISPCFLHHIRHAGRAKPGDAIRIPTLSAFFAEARDLAGIQWPEEKTPPSFHELRSLSARLYTEQGINAQALLGHKSADMTAIYRDTRGAEWVEVKTA